METMLVLIGGLLVRLLHFVLLFALFAMPVVAVVYLAHGAVALHRRAAARWMPVARTGGPASRIPPPTRG